MAWCDLSVFHCDGCKVNDCKSFKRVLQVLQKYDEWLYSETNKEVNCISNTMHESFTSYSTRNMINCYKHIKAMEYNMSMDNDVLCTQSLTACIPYSRHKRDIKYNEYQQLYFTMDIKEILIQKMLDQIHLYLYHPLLSRNDKTNNRFGTNKENALMDENETKYEESSIVNVMEEQKDINQKQEEEEKEEEEEKNELLSNLSVDIHDLEKDAYSFGKQFFYWDYFRNHKWFITKKYKNLKDEVLNNEMCKIDEIDFDIEYENALEKKEDDDRIKTLRSNGEFKYKYGIEENIEITMNHLLSILFYCNTNHLQNAFSSTFRRLVNINESDEQFKVRHSHYYHFAKLLRETVEVFGSVMVDDNLTLYHGIDDPLYFTQMIAKFYSPTSTSKNRMIAAQFAGNNGMILEVGKYERNGFYFDCFLSGYDREEEYLLIGGYAALRIKNILHFKNDEEEIGNYSEYLLLIQCFFAVLRNENVDQKNLSMLNQNKNQILTSLIQYQCDDNMTDENIPIYIYNLFKFRCDKMNHLEIDLLEFKRIYGVCMNNTMLDINLLTQIFHHLGGIKIILPNNFTFSDQVTRFLYENLALYAVRSSATFQKIEFCFHSKLIPYSIRDQMASRLHDDFDNIGWALSVETNIESDESIYFIKFDEVINPYYRPLAAALRRQSTAQNIEEELKEHSIIDEKKIEKIKSSSFQKIIPYHQPLLSITKLSALFPFCSDPAPRLRLWRNVFVFELLICLICVFQTCVQFWFILSAPSPYRWISLGFFAFNQLVQLIIICTLFAFEEEDVTGCIAIIMCLGLTIAFPVIPVAMWILAWIATRNNPDDAEENSFVFSTLWLRCFTVMVSFLFQAFPQIVMLVVMMSNYGYQLDTDPTQVINWSYLSSVLMMISFCIIFASVYEDSAMYILNTIWLWLDYVSLLFLLSAAFYDSNGLILLITDLSISFIPFVIFPIGVAMMMYNEEDDDDMPLCVVLAILCCVECLVAVFSPLFLVLFAPWTFSIICFFSQLFWCNFSPFCTNFFTMKFEEEWKSWWYKYRVFKWIKNGNDRNEKEMRLCCTNMIMLDAFYAEGLNEFTELRHEFHQNIKIRSQFGKECAKSVGKSKHSKFKWNWYVHTNNKQEDEMGNRYIIGPAHIYFVTRVIHFFMPIIMGIYIGYQENWKFNNINSMTKYLGVITAGLYLLCAIGFICAWSSLYYHRMIIPFVIGVDQETIKFDTNVQHIAMCYVAIAMIGALEDAIGNRDIANIIVGYVASIQRDEKENSLNESLQMLGDDS